MHLSSITLSMRMQYRKLFATTLSGVSFGLPAHLRTFDQVASEPSHAKSTCLYIHSFYVLVLRLIIFLSYVKMHFSYVKSKILCRWLDILRNYDHSRILITQKVHPLLPPGQPPPPPPPGPGPPPDPTRHPTRPTNPPCPSSHLALHPTLHATTRPAWPRHPTRRPAFPDSLASLVSHDGVASAATRWCRPCPPATAVCVGCKSTCNPLQYSTHPI